MDALAMIVKPLMKKFISIAVPYPIASRYALQWCIMPIL
jgi:hypothetical protein